MRDRFERCVLAAIDRLPHQFDVRYHVRWFVWGHFHI